jgi:hypothetical protein
MKTPLDLSPSARAERWLRALIERGERGDLLSRVATVGASPAAIEASVARHDECDRARRRKGVKP